MKVLERVIKKLHNQSSRLSAGPTPICILGRERCGRCKAFILDAMHKHFEAPNTTPMLLFADFSAFNTLRPHILAERLTTRLHLEDTLFLWILDFLTNRPQRVLVNIFLTPLTLQLVHRRDAFSPFSCSFSTPMSAGPPTITSIWSSLPTTKSSCPFCLAPYTTMGRL